jgi:ABC-type Fe3+/spermidine/putrescine transport system ATPase subunit
MNAAPLLELRSVTKVFPDGHAAVRGVSDVIAAGEYMCILGPSGCGKTTLLRLVAGFETPSAGDVRLEGRSVVGVPPERRNLNLVFQDYALFPHLSVLRNVSFGLEVKGMARGEAARRAGEALEPVGLGDAAGKRPNELSGGQRQRVALARALINRPSVLLLDEPLSALDRALRLQMQTELRRIQRDVGITFLHVTHDQGEALSLADRVAVMHQGRFVQVGPPREVYHRPASRLVAEFVGASNVLDRRAVERWLGGRPAAGVHDESAVLIRPERIVLSGTAAGAIPGRVVRTAFLGPTLECEVAVDGARLLVHTPAAGAGPPIAEGGAVWLRIDPADVVPLRDETA